MTEKIKTHVKKTGYDKMKISLRAIKNWVKRNRLNLLVAFGFLGYFALSIFVWSFDSLKGAYFLFTGISALLIYYAFKTT